MALAVVFLVVGAVLLYLAYGLVTNHGGMGDWWFRSEEHRRELARGGTTVFPNRRHSVPRVGYAVGVLAVAFLVAAVSLL